jgi:hypothetical protein
MTRTTSICSTWGMPRLRTCWCLATRTLLVLPDVVPVMTPAEFLASLAKR